MAPLKSVLLAGLASALASTCSGDSCETGDQTALLQSHLSRKSDLSLSQHSAQSAAFFPKLSSLNDPHTRKSALLEIEKTAIKLASMDRTEATPVVIEVCTETAELLNTTVLYAIIEEDAADRAALEAAYAGFDQWESQRAEAEAALEAAEAIVTQKANSLASCRMTERETCINETICTEETHDDCEERDRVERELQEIDEEIHRAWCQEGATPEIRTETTFRTSSVEVFHRYTEKWNQLTGLQGDCERVVEHCETTLSRYIEQATMCNTKQNELQMASCEYHHVAAGALTAYQQGFQAALAFYNDVVARVMIEEADRKVEWDVLTRVICLLLTLTNEEDGVVSNAETEARIQRCWDDEVDVSHLDIDYLDPPDMLSLPELPPLPCTAEHRDHYHSDPPAECAALIELHNTGSNSECSCLADELADQTLMLGHYLMIDPSIVVNVVGGSQWQIQMDGVTYAGQLSTIHTGTFPVLSENMLTEEQLTPTEDDGTPNEDYTGPITGIAWAYPSMTANWEGAMSLAQRFASRGGMVFLNSQSQVVEVRELASSSGPLGQPVTATLSFSSAEEITDAQVQAACPNGLHQVPETSRYYTQGGREYCWVMTNEISQCAQGCFIYQLVNSKVVFPLIEGMHLTATTR